MSTSADDLLASLLRGGENFDTILQPADSPKHRAARFAAGLRPLVPSSPLFACTLRQCGTSHTCVLDKTGNERADWALLLDMLLQPANDQPGRIVDLPPGIALPGQRLAVQEIIWRGPAQGTLAVAIDEAAPEANSSQRAALALWGRELALRLEMEALENQRVEEMRYAECGELGAALAHEINNFLNALLLQLAVLQQEGSKELRGDLDEIRRQAAGVVTMTKQFRQSRSGRDMARDPVDLNQLSLEVLQSLNPLQKTGTKEPAQPLRAFGIEIQLDFTTPLPFITGSAIELRHLLRLLLKNAAAVMTPGQGFIRIRTLHTGENVQLLVEDIGPTVPTELLHKLFEPTVICREGTNSLELAACRSIVRRCKGKIEAQNRPEGGLTIVVELAAAKEIAG